MLYGKEGTITLEKVQAVLRTMRMWVLVVSCWDQEEGGVSHRGNEDTYKLTFM